MQFISCKLWLKKVVQKISAPTPRRASRPTGRSLGMEDLRELRID